MVVIRKWNWNSSEIPFDPGRRVFEQTSVEEISETTEQRRKSSRNWLPRSWRAMSNWEIRQSSQLKDKRTAPLPPIYQNLSLFCQTTLSRPGTPFSEGVFFLWGRFWWTGFWDLSLGQGFNALIKKYVKECNTINLDIGCLWNTDVDTPAHFMVWEWSQVPSDHD